MQKLKEYKDDLGLHSVEFSYIILWHNGEYDVFDGKLEDAISYVKSDKRYNNYGHNGATIICYRQIYSIQNETIEKVLV